MTFTNQFLAIPGADLLFGASTRASLVIFAPTDTAWTAAATALGKPLGKVQATEKEGKQLRSGVLGDCLRSHREYMQDEPHSSHCIYV